MNGAECLVGTLINHGVDHLFTNPGTSEIGLVDEIAKTDQIRAVPVLFEGIAAGAADGYFRMTGRPAATMLHVGPGLANAWSALHNAAKARSGVLNIVGQLSNVHLQYESPLKSDLLALASSVSDVVRYPLSPTRVGTDVQAAAVAARQGKVSTLLMPNDVGWSDGAALPTPTEMQDAQGPVALDPDAMAALELGTRTLLLLGNMALDAEAQQEAAAIASATGCGLMIEWANARCERGRDLPSLVRIPYQVDKAVRALATYDTIVLCGAVEPIAFFNYLNSPSRLAAPGTRVLELHAEGANVRRALRAARRGLASKQARPCRPSALPHMDVAPESLDAVSAVIAAALPEGAIVVNEAITSASGLFAASATAPRHTWLDNLGGSIGFALPVAIGASIGAPGRRVIALCGDGSTMYSPQGLWTIARENLDVTVLLFANSAYKILIDEMMRASNAFPDERAYSLFRLNDPSISWTELSGALGVSSTRAASCEQLEVALALAFHTKGPHLIEIAV